MIRGWEFKDSLTQYATDSSFFLNSRNHIFEVIHVGISCDPATEHFEHSKPGAPEDKVLGNVSRFSGEYVLLEPIIERVIFGDAAKKAHRGMRVAINHSRQNQCADRQ